MNVIAHQTRLTSENVLDIIAGYDVIIAWSPYTGPLFRGVASNPWGGGILQDALCGLAGIGAFALGEHHGEVRGEIAVAGVPGTLERTKAEKPRPGNDRPRT